MQRTTFRKLFVCTLLLLALCPLQRAGAASSLDGKVIINEWSQQSGGDWVELLVTQPADLRGLWVCDEGGPSATDGLQLSTTDSFWSSIPAGTIILFHANNSAFVEDHDPSDYKLVFNGSTLADPALFDAVNKNFKAYGGGTATDNPRVFDKDLQLIHDWDQGNDAAFTGALRATAAGDADAYTSNTATGVSDAANWTKITSGATPGEPNGGANTTWVGTLREQLEGKVIINEWSQQSGGDWVELLVTHEADLRGLWVCDDGGPSATDGLQLSLTHPFWSAVPAGTLILFHANNAAFSEDVNPADYKLVINGSTLADPTLFDAVNKNFKAYGGGTATDNPRLFDKNLALVHDWDQGNDAAFTGTLRATAAGDTDAYTSNTTTGVSNAANWSKITSGATPGTPNGGANTTWIEAMYTTVAPDPIIAVSPGTLNFGSIDSAATSTGSLTISNLGATQNLTVTVAALTGTDAAKFSVLTALPINVAAGSSSTLTLEFAPGGTTGSFAGQLDLTSNDPETALTTVTLTASATASGGSALSGKVIINEWQQSADGDWIEILVTETADLRGLWICDSGGPDAANGLQFSTTDLLWASVPAGTLITVYDSGQPITQDVDGSDYNLALVSDAAEALVYWDATNQHFKAFSSGNATDNPRLFDQDLVLLHDWDQGDDAAFTGALRATVALDTNVYNGNSAAGVENAANWSLVNEGVTPNSSSAGQPNGGINTTWIQALRSLSQPAAASDWVAYP